MKKYEALCDINTIGGSVIDEGIIVILKSAYFSGSGIKNTTEVILEEVNVDNWLKNSWTIPAIIFQTCFDEVK